MTKAAVVPEKGVLRACMDLLAAERVWAIRMNTVAMRTAKGRPIFAHTGGAGLADILATPSITRNFPWGTYRIADLAGGWGSIPIVLWIETKSSVGVQSAEQIEFQQQVEERKHFYLLARSSDDVIGWLREHR